MLSNTDGITPVFPYERPMRKRSYFKKEDYVNDEYYDRYICPNNKILKYTTTNRKGHREYKSNRIVCESCPYISRCTQNQNHVKVVTRHVWEECMEEAEDIRHDLDNRELYEYRKEAIERVFGIAKEYHGMRYTREVGIARMGMNFGVENRVLLANINKSRKNVLPSLRDRLQSETSYKYN